MKKIAPSFYKNFKCIAGDCPDSCCQGWVVDADEESLRYYATLSPDLEIKRRIDSVLDTDEFGNTIFTLTDKKRCPFLNSDNLCDMHIAIGQEHTPITCRNFPRFIYDFGGTREIGISFSCPVAADMMYNLGTHITFECEVDSELPVINDIDAELYYLLLKSRRDIYSILQNDEKSIPDRLIEMLAYAESLQNKICDLREGGDSISFVDVFDNPELINPEWQQHLEQYSNKEIATNYANENIAVYFIYKYFMQAVYDSNVILPVKMAVLGVLIHTYFGESSWTIHLWSKETEHSQYNMDRYKKLLMRADCLTVENLILRVKENKQFS